MEYEIQEKEYTLGEFYKLYKDNLPTIAMVTQGFSGDRLEETFDYGQVIRINSVYRQQRVIAVRLNERGNEECTYSFPVDYPIQFCLDEMVCQNNSLTLAEILDKRDLPVDVKFARKQFIKIGDNTSSTSLLFNLRLTKVFDEIYLLGNFIFDGDLDLQIVQIPLYLSAMKFSKVTGVKVKGNTDWKAFLRKLDRKAYQINFDAFSGNHEIARYKPNREENALMYENLYPQMYTNISDLIGMDKPSQLKTTNVVNDGLYEPFDTSFAGETTIKTADRLKSTHNTSQTKTQRSDDAFLYEPLVIVPAGNTDRKTTITNLNHKQKSTHDNGQRKSIPFQKKLMSELTDLFQKGFVTPKYPSSNDRPPIISPKPKLNRRVSEPLLTGKTPEEVLPSEVVQCLIPSTPTRLSTYPQPELHKSKSFSASSETYENMKISGAEVHPSTYRKSDVTWNEENTVKVGQAKSQSSNLESREDKNDTETVNVGSLKVAELGRWMADKLRLGRYVARFAEELVDGAMLIDLNENLLKEEFGFSPMEAKRLIKFAKEGHVPR
ncbi:hypothetical protein CHS0354_005804 [Potamilus streckersoni]|uniref:SAM domain-containing protein n=1 Tax=Potamilus streckersoni TaxID=2493646 RepID=A0AAE0SVX1_9BIVA|nr:hypothetical protein CHS0354_005804 [Potamilus streckersoni]